MKSQPPLRVLLLSLALIAAAFSSVFVSAAQGQAVAPTGTDTPKPPLCEPSVIDGTFTFASQPAGEQTVTLHFRNVGKVTCRLTGRIGTSFAVDGHSMHVAECWLCDENDEPLPYEDRQPTNQVIVSPGGDARVDLHWASRGESCQWGDWVDFLMTWAKPTGYLFVPSNWPLHLCSPVRSSGYRREAKSPRTGAVADGGIRVSLAQEAIYEDETATLHVELTDPKFAAPQTPGCASLFRVMSGPGEATRLDPLSTVETRPVASFTAEQLEEDKDRAWPDWKKDRLRPCDLAAGKTAADVRIPAQDLAKISYIEWRTNPMPGKEAVFLSTAVHFPVLDTSTLAPNWGDTTDGIRAGLSVDRDSFRSGERIAVHLHWENVDAGKTLGQGECWEPEPSIEIQNAQHAVLATLPTYAFCNMHGWGPFVVEKGKPRQTLQELTSDAPPEPVAAATAQVNPPFLAPKTPVPQPPTHFVGQLPGPGVYYLVAVWTPRVLDEGPGYGAVGDLHIGRGKIAEEYGTARSQPVRVEITAAETR
jgi:hypothetical protein